MIDTVNVNLAFFTQAQDATGDAAGSAKSAAGDVSGSAKSATGDVTSSAKSAAGDVKGAAQSAGRQVDQATPDLSGVFDDIAGKVIAYSPHCATLIASTLACLQTVAGRADQPTKGNDQRCAVPDTCRSNLISTCFIRPRKACELNFKDSAL